MAEKAQVQRSLSSLLKRVETEFQLQIDGVVASDAVIEQALSNEMPLGTSPTKKATWLDQKDYFWALVYLAFAELLVFTAFNSALSTLTKIFPDFGYTNLTIVFFSFGLSCMFAPAVVARLHPKWCMLAAGCGFTFWIAMLMTNVLGLVIASSVIVGMSNALNWIAQGTYAARSRAGPRGNNAFWLIFFLSWLLGGVVGGVVLNYLNVLAYQGTMLGICAAGTVMLAFARPLPRPEKEVHDTTLRGLFRPVTLFRYGRLYLIVSTYLTRTTYLGFFLATFPRLVPSAQLIPYLTISTALCLTAAEVVFLLFWEKAPLQVWGSLQFFFVGTGLVISYCIYFIPMAQDTLVILLYVVAGTFGLSEAFGMALLSSFGLILFPTEPASFFGVFRLLEGFSAAIMILLGAYTSPVVVISVVSFFALVSIVCIFVLGEWVRRREMKQMLTTQNPIYLGVLPLKVDQIQHVSPNDSPIVHEKLQEV